MLQVTTDQGKSSQFQTERARGEEHSTIFRHGIFKKMAEKKIANNQGVDIFGGASYNVGGNVPVQQRLETKGIMEEQKMGGELHSTKKLTGDLQKIVQAVDEKMSQQGFKGSVSVECFKRSVYGRFSDTYKLLRDTIVQDDLMTTLIPYVFKGSRILANNCEGIVLYFNLPLKENWFPKPKRIFPVEKDLGSQTVKYIYIYIYIYLEIYSYFLRKANIIPPILFYSRMIRVMKYSEDMLLIYGVSIKSIYIHDI